MRTFFLALSLTAAAAACAQDETLHAYGAAGAPWQLQSLFGAPLSVPVTLAFPEPGQITGQAPCNRYFGPQTAPYPWFAAGPLAATQMACPALDEESRYLQALEAMTISEVSGDTLVLSDEAGREIVFTRPPGG